MGPHEVSANTRELLGRAKAEARLLEAHGWTPVHIIVGTNRSFKQQLQHIAQAFGDPRAKAAQRQQGSQPDGRSVAPEPAAGIARGSKSREGWVQWQAPRKTPEKQDRGGTRSMSQAGSLNGSSDAGAPSRGEPLVQRHQGGPVASSQIRSHLPYAGHTHPLMASLAASAHL